MTTSTILNPNTLLSLVPTLLPPSNPSLTTPQHALAVLSHSILSSLGFRLANPTSESNTDSPSSSNPSPSPNTLPPSWTPTSLQYKHTQSSLQFIITLSSLGHRTIINAIAVESDKPYAFDVSTPDFVSLSAFPYVLSSTESTEQSTPLKDIYISHSRISDFVSLFKLNIVQKLVPGLRKEGYQEEVEQERQGQQETRSTTSSTRIIPRYNPSEEFPLRSPPQPQPPSQSHIPPQNPLEIGRRDLDPIGLPSPSSSNSFNPPPLFPSLGDGDGGGMYVGPDHPIFNARFGRGEGGERRGTGPWGGDGYLPPMGAPPGARFDPVGPVGPFGASPFGSAGGVFPGVGGRRGSGRRFPHPFPLPGEGDPDNDEFMPPGSGDMFM
ncbi:PI31 proteasome regulator N-terminal-domain-containing protein [Lentinula aff. detonsa]|uniref:PI31 proteasome regulator N-terminal-domain-containing protein n=1 Tax=Lentinula aff. detonsa TaxID=2804958 RepID=A0AA38NSW4_9AGAR|nr:PI31 proteasome regulator N-terminal-domain-containing protein [Lentinula aff. detonsa]